MDVAAERARKMGMVGGDGDGSGDVAWRGWRTTAVDKVTVAELDDVERFVDQDDFDAPAAVAFSDADVGDLVNRLGLD